MQLYCLIVTRNPLSYAWGGGGRYLVIPQIHTVTPDTCPLTPYHYPDPPYHYRCPLAGAPTTTRANKEPAVADFATGPNSQRVWKCDPVMVAYL